MKRNIQATYKDKVVANIQKVMNKIEKIYNNIQIWKEIDLFTKKIEFLF